MKALALGLVGSLMFTSVVLAQEDPCAGTDLTDGEVGLAYQGHCLVADSAGAPVQSIIVQRTEDLDGAESVHGVLLIRTIDGWVVGPDEFYADSGIADAEVGDGGHLIVDDGQ